MATDVFLIQTESAVFLENSYYNLGLLSIATTLKSNGFSVKTVMTQDFHSMTYSQREDFFKSHNPRIVGFNVNSDNVFTANYIAEDVKKWLPGSTTVAGGPLPSLQGIDFFEKFSFDMLSTGEGEFPILKLAKLLIRKDANIDINDIEGLIYKSSGKIKINKRAKAIQNLDVLPSADYSLLGIGKAFRYSSGRGCPFRCSFCCQAVHDKGYRYFSPDRVISDIQKNIQLLNATAVGIIDDTFVAHIKRATEICKRLAELNNTPDGPRFVMTCEGRIDTLYENPYLAELLYKAGVRTIQLGIENGNQEILDLYNKRITLEQIEAVVRNLTSAGIVVMSNFIIGGAKETLETFENTLNFDLKLTKIRNGFFESETALLCPYPGTDVAKNPEKYEIEITDSEWVKSLTIQTPSCRTKTLSVKDMFILNRKYRERIMQARVDAIREAPFETVLHLSKLFDYGLPTIYYSTVISQTKAMVNYLDHYKKGAFKRLDEIPVGDVSEYIPVKTASAAEKTDGAYIIGGYLDETILTDSLEKDVYDSASLGLTIGEIAKRLEAKYKDSDILSKKILPFIKKMENRYLMIFYR